MTGQTRQEWQRNVWVAGAIQIDFSWAFVHTPTGAQVYHGRISATNPPKHS